MENVTKGTRRRTQAELVRYMYEERNLPVREIMRATELCENTVYTMLHEMGVQPDRKGNFRFVSPRDNEQSYNKIVELYAQKTPVAQIARLTGYSREWVYSTLEKRGVIVRGAWKPTALPPEFKAALDGSGINFNQWRCKYGFSPSLSYDVVMGRRKALRGKSKMIKEQLVADFPAVFGDGAKFAFAD